MCLNPKLLGSVLSCVRLGPAVVPCSVAYQIFWDLVIRIDAPFPRGVRTICLVLKSVITGKIFKTLAKAGPVCPLVKLLSPTNPAWAPCTSFQVSLSCSSKGKSSSCFRKWLFSSWVVFFWFFWVFFESEMFFRFTYFSYSNKSSLNQVISPGVSMYYLCVADILLHHNTLKSQPIPIRNSPVLAQIVLKCYFGLLSFRTTLTLSTWMIWICHFFFLRINFSNFDSTFNLLHPKFSGDKPWSSCSERWRARLLLPFRSHYLAGLLTMWPQEHFKKSIINSI